MHTLMHRCETLNGWSSICTSAQSVKGVTIDHEFDSTSQEYSIYRAQNSYITMIDLQTVFSTI